ncbi:MAG TPA: nuclear transport factor 2 family protein, partial [Microlunatus sp.]|nr:nuclear transport factor 2 family protein [Microlunatus sp.]
EQIRQLITAWVRAVHAGDMRTVLARHTADIVMFDVPPPERGVLGIRAYEETWPPFFAWQASGATFELDDLQIVAGTEVAYAYALLWCGSPDELVERPERRLRISFGLHRDDGVWVIQHEHHSFPL